MENAPAVPSANARVVQIEIRQAAVVRKFLGMFENVANTPNRMNQGSLGVGVVAYFAPQAIEVNVNHVGCGVHRHFPDMVQNHGPRDYATLVAAKIFQQRKFLGSQLQQMIAPSCFPTYQIEP